MMMIRSRIADSQLWTESRPGSEGSRASARARHAF